MQHVLPSYFRPNFCAVAIAVLFGLSGCGGDSDTTSTSADYTIPTTPAGLGYADKADAPSGITAYVDSGATNQRGDACMSTVDTNAGVRVVSGFLDIWTPRSLFVDGGGTTAPANGACAAVVASDWDGIPGSATDGKVKNQAIHDANIAYVESVTKARTADQELAAYLDDRRGKGYSVSDGMGPLTDAWRKGAQQTTTITSIAADATTKAYSDGGNNTGVGSSTNTDMGLAVDLLGQLDDASTEPAKRFFKYARPYRWSANVVVAPSLVMVKSTTPNSDGGFISGHTAEGWRDALTMAYLVPQRFQEMLARATEMGENRILAGMHSPLDVIGGRIQAQAVMAYNLNKASKVALKTTAYAQAQSWLQKQAGVSSFADLNAYAHSVTTTNDRFADYTSNKTNFIKRMTYGFPQIASATKLAVVPKGAEALLETRLPYLSADQRRVVLKTTSIASGYPVMDDAEGWGRLNLFAAADGYGAFNGDVSVNMDAAQGGFSAQDSWKNDIAGAGKLTKQGTGTLRLSGNNSYTGGSVIEAGTLAADSLTALGKGDVYLKSGTVQCTASGVLTIAGAYTQIGGTLQTVMSAANKGVINVSGTATLAGGSLNVSFAGGYKPAVGDTLTVLSAGKRNGNFSSVSVAGFSKVTPIYTSTGVQIRIDAI